MMARVSALLLAALLAAANPKLEAGVELYRSGDLVGSLPILLEALDAGSQSERAKARLYVGLIQHRTGNERDAAGSFRIALDLAPGIRPPKGTPKATLAAFDRVRGEREAPPPKKLRKRVEDETRVEQEGTRDGPELLEPVEGGARREEWSAAETRAIDDPIAETELEGRAALELPVVGWVAAGVGAAALISGITLGVMAKVNNDRAFEDTDKGRAADIHSAAGVQHKASIASFGAAGVLFGFAAISLTF
jgi:hypothetical protein